MSQPPRKDLPHFETIAGAGETRPWITMVHGASQHSGLFSAQVDAFEADYRLLLIDLPGHGRSSAMPGPYGITEYARSVLAAMQAAAVERTHFWGTHTGAGIALLLAAQHPPRIASMILDGAILPGVDLPYVTARIARARATARERGVEAARAEWFRESRWFDVIRARPAECRAKAHWDLIAEFSGRPWTDATEAAPVAPIGAALARMAQPVLLVNGEHDVEDFIRVADEIESGIPNVQRVAVAEAGGFPLWEFPARVNALVRQFLERQATPPPRAGGLPASAAEPER
jgi:pimeloyl-ACP methyl ester carboxylesterase